MRESDLLLKQQEQLYGIQKIIKSCSLSLDDITELIPGMVHLNKIQTLDLTYLDKRSRQILELTQEEVILHGRQVIRDIVKPDSFEYAKQLFGKFKFDDPSHVISHFQAIKGWNKDGSYEWFFSVKKKFDDERIITISNPISTLSEMQDQVKKILEENLYIKNNLHTLKSLTSREKEIIKLIFQGYSSKQIAEKLFISPHTVTTHRKNIKKKLEIKSYNELYKFAVEFDLI